MPPSLLTNHNTLGWRTGRLAQDVLAAPPAPVCAAQRRRLSVKVQGFQIGSSSTSSAATARQQQTAIVAIDPTGPSRGTGASPSQKGPSVPIIALAVGAIGLVAIVVKKLRNRGLDDDTARYSVNLHLANVMKDVNTVRIEDLSVDQIAAARARRSKERANHKLSLEEVELPQNHPFATKQALTKEEQEQSLQNLKARSIRRRNYEAMQQQGGGAGGGGGRMGPGGAFGRQR